MRSNHIPAGRSLFPKEQFSKAKPLFQEYLEEHPTHKKTREYLGDIAGYAKERDTAMSYYKALVSKEPTNANFHFKCGGALGMKALEDQPNFNEAL